MCVVEPLGTQDGSEDLLLTIPNDLNELQLSFKDLFKIFKAILNSNVHYNSAFTP